MAQRDADATDVAAEVEELDTTEAMKAPARSEIVAPGVEDKNGSFVPTVCVD